MFLSRIAVAGFALYMHMCIYIHQPGFVWVAATGTVRSQRHHAGGCHQGATLLGVWALPWSRECQSWGWGGVIIIRASMPQAAGPRSTRNYRFDENREQPLLRNFLEMRSICRDQQYRSTIIFALLAVFMGAFIFAQMTEYRRARANSLERGLAEGRVSVNTVRVPTTVENLEDGLWALAKLKSLDKIRRMGVLAREPVAVWAQLSPLVQFDRGEYQRLHDLEDKMLLAKAFHKVEMVFQAQLQTCTLQGVLTALGIRGLHRKRQLGLGHERTFVSQ